MKLIEKDGALIAENAVVVGRVSLGRGASVWYHAVVRGDLAAILIGEFTNVQDGCVLHTDPHKDLIIGKHVTIGHMATVHCKSVGDYSLVGINSILLGGAVIGEGSLIAAGALIKEDQVIPPRSIVMGVPGRIVGQTTDAHLKAAEERALRYHKLARRHAEDKADPRFMENPPAPV